MPLPCDRPSACPMLASAQAEFHSHPLQPPVQEEGVNWEPLFRYRASPYW